MADPLTVLFKNNPDRRVTIGAIILDATVEERHEFNATVTQHPIEDGGFVSDHVYESPRIVSITAEITDSPVVFFSALGGLTNRRIEAYDQLTKLYHDKDIVKVITGLKVYTDMVIKTLTFPRNQGTGRRLQFSAEFEQINKVASEIVGVAEQKAADDAKDKVGENKDLGRQETQATTDSQENKAKDKSLLLQVLGG